MRTYLRAVSPAIIGLGLAASLAVATPAWAGASTQKTASRGFDDGLSAVAAVSGSDAWAVGIWHNAGRHEQTLTEHWNGSRWQIVVSPNPAGPRADNELDAVAATSRSNAWAVGQFWNGANWQPQIDHWNGKAWRAVKTPDPGGHAARDDLAGVTATSPSSAWAVGEYTAGSTERALILHWNGRRWRQVPSPNVSGSPGSGLTGVAFGSKSSAWAAGSSWTASSSSVQQTLTEHWNGRSWQVIASPDPNGPTQTNELNAIAAAGPQAWAVGDAAIGTTFLPLAFRWDGTSWQVCHVPLPAGTARGAFWGVGSSPSGKAWAVGNSSTGHGGTTLIEHWNGTAWKRVASPNR